MRYYVAITGQCKFEENEIVQLQKSNSDARVGNVKPRVGTEWGIVKMEIVSPGDFDVALAKIIDICNENLSVIKRTKSNILVAITQKKESSINFNIGQDTLMGLSQIPCSLNIDTYFIYGAIEDHENGVDSNLYNDNYRLLLRNKKGHLIGSRSTQNPVFFERRLNQLLQDYISSKQIKKNVVQLEFNIELNKSYNFQYWMNTNTMNKLIGLGLSIQILINSKR